MNKEEIIRVLEKAMDLEENSLTEDDVLEDMSEWDSLSKLAFVAAVKEKFNKYVSIKALADFFIVQDVIEYFENEE